MGAYDFMINISQEVKILEQAKTIEELNEKCDLLYEWVQYLNKELQELKDKK